MAEEVVKLLDLSGDEVPEEFRCNAYFDFEAHPFAHQALFEESASVWHAICGIGDYTKKWLAGAVAKAKGKGQVVTADNAPAHTLVKGAFQAIVGEGATFEPSIVIGKKGDEPGTIIVSAGASVIGCALYVDKGDIYIGSGTVVEPGVGLKGATIIGEDCEIRQGTYLRGDCILGNGCTIRGEIKNTVVMDKSNFPHPSYLGDSACGYMTHFGNQATAANLGIYEGVREKEKRHNLKLRIGGKAYDLGSPKMGVCMGDFCQVGCNSTTDPGTFLRPFTIAYTLTRITKGIYGPDEVLKNKPMEHGVIERAPLRPL